MLQAQLQISEQDIRTVQSTTQASGLPYVSSIKLGQLAQTSDNRQYVYAQNNGTTAAVAGNLQTASAAIANHVGRNPSAAAAANQNIVTITLGATAATQDQYMQGYMVVTAGAGNGTLYKIRSNTAAASSGVTTVTLQEPLQVALTTGSTVSLYPSYYNNVAITSTTLTNNNIVGATNVAVPVNNYTWLQVYGPCAVATDASTITKNALLIGGATAGTVGLDTAASVTQTVGYAPEALTASSLAQPVNLQII